MSIKERYSLRYIIWTLCLSLAGTTLGIVLFVLIPSNGGIGYHPGDFTNVAPEFREEMLAFNQLIENTQEAISSASSKCPTLAVWILVMTVGLTFAPMLLFESSEGIKKIHRVFGYPTKALRWIIPCVILALFVVILLPHIFSKGYTIELKPPIRFFYLKLNIYMLITAIASSMAIIVLVISGNIAYNLRKRVADDNSITRYYILNQLQTRFLFMLGFLVSISSLATFLMHRIHIEMFGERQPFINEQSVAAEGMFYTFVLAIFFIPARRELHRYGQRIIDREFGIRPPDGTSWQAWLSERDAMEQTLDLKTDWKERLKWAVPVLAPLVSSVLPEQLLG